MKKQTIKLNEFQLRKMIKETLNELDWKTYKNAANKRLAQGKYANANELSDMAKNRFDDEFNDNYRYDTLGAKLAGKHSKTFNSSFIPTEEPSLQGRNEKGEELFRNNGRYYNSRRGLTTPEKFFKDKQMSDTFNTATQELDNYNNGNYDYTPDKGWHLKESRLNKIIKESIKKALNEMAVDPMMQDDPERYWELRKEREYAKGSENWDWIPCQDPMLCNLYGKLDWIPSNEWDGGVYRDSDYYEYTFDGRNLIPISDNDFESLGQEGDE